ncbi:MAG: sigma 54-interacting transcriptional regulator [Isosphaeraceae bacterium]|nr:sigma 54-interacting transcriptional regulator [Isosphaeraceae bacterium]
MMAVLGVVAIAYSVWVLWIVATSGDIGVRCVLGIEVKEAVPTEYEWEGGRPGVGDTLDSVDGRLIRHYPDYVDALRRIRRKAGESVSVSWTDLEGQAHAAKARVRTRPFSTYIWAVLWFVQEMVIFALGARVFWKRPRDESARLFFQLCVFTVGAYMGGVHWSEIVVEPVLTYGFVAFAVFVPIVSLHFALVFPRIHPIFARHRRAVPAALYGLGLVEVAVIYAAIAWTRWSSIHAGDVETAVLIVKMLAFTSIGISFVLFVLFFTCLLRSYVRGDDSRTERHQVKWILLATLLSFPLILYLLWRAVVDPSRLGRASAAWPMYGVSLLYTLAYASSITRYKLMQVDDLFNRTKLYLSVSVAAGLLYSAVLVVSALLIGERLLDERTGREGIAAGVTAIALLILSGAIRERFQKAIDRRFYREKYKFDQAMRKMKLAVGSLVDRETLGRRLLEAAVEILRVDWGAIYLVDPSRGWYALAASLGPEPEERKLPVSHPVPTRLESTPSLRASHSAAQSSVPGDAADAMIALGGEVAYALEADGKLAGFLILGPKRSGLPYEDEEIAFLGALSSVATLALHSAEIQQTLETLNRDLRDKVEKIAEQQRRILILQDQLVGGGASAGVVTSDGEGSTPSLSDQNEPVDAAFARIRGSGPAMKRMIDVARKVASSPSPVLIRGESGTGKELLAEAIHLAGPRAGRAFVKVHCAALSQNLLESELFGHVRGAFTGADRDRVGRFEQADGGTLFLDEIGDINLEVQTKLLRVLQEMSFERVGSSQSISVDVRILAATHQDLEGLIRAGRFREDLYYRLNVIPVRTPSLRERREDIFELSIHFLREHARRAGRSVSHLDDDALEALVRYDWPGNIRELENVIERAVVLAEGPALSLHDLPSEIRMAPGARKRGRPPRVLVPITSIGSTSRARSASVGGGGAPQGADADPELDAFERTQLIDALQEAGGNKSEAARLFGVPRSTFCSKLKRHGLA